MKKSLNIKYFVSNIPFLMSAGAYFCLNFNEPATWIPSLVIAMFILLFISLRNESFYKLQKENGKRVRLFSAIASVGVCWQNLNVYFYNIDNPSTMKLLNQFNIGNNITFAVGVALAILSFYFVYIWVEYIINKVAILLKSYQVFSDIKLFEIIIYSLFLLVSAGLIIFSFTNSKGLWGLSDQYDILYSSDSLPLIKESVFVNLLQNENDIRQPLFAIFAAPFTGITYLITNLLMLSEKNTAILIAITNSLFMLFSFFLLSKAMKLNSLKRVCWMLFCFLTYVFFLFTIMIEQYVFAVFWLVLGIYAFVEEKEYEEILFCGATGTLLTSGLILPFIANKFSVFDFKNWIIDIFKKGIRFLILVLAFCRLDVFINIISSYKTFTEFCGEEITIYTKICMYFDFVKNCFFAPSTITGKNSFGFETWHLAMPNALSILGIIIFVLCLISAIVNRKKRSSVFSGVWVLFSVVMLLILGWGSAENGLILYSLYFGWAFFALIFQLVEVLEEKLKVKFIIPVFTIGISVVLLIENIPAIKDTIMFFINSFPI